MCLGQGLSSLIGKNFESQTILAIPKLPLPLLSDIPVIGKTLFNQDIVVYATILLAVVIWWVLTKTRLGLIIRSIGENPHAARAIGFSVIWISCAAIAFGGALAGIAGAYASTVYTPLWADGMIAGRGWIALALVVFGTWRTGRVFFGSVLFGALSLGELAAQAGGCRLAVAIAGKRSLSGDHPDAGCHFVQPQDDAPECHRLAGTAVSRIGHAVVADFIDQPPTR